MTRVETSLEGVKNVGDIEKDRDGELKGRDGLTVDLGRSNSHPYLARIPASSPREKGGL
jgi:hypothetical protein